jgi:hypothetical protein
MTTWGFHPRRFPYRPDRQRRKRFFGRAKVLLSLGDRQVGDRQVGDRQVGDRQVGDRQVGDRRRHTLGPPAVAELKLGLGSAGASPSRHSAPRAQFPASRRSQIPLVVALSGDEKNQQFSQ